MSNFVYIGTSLDRYIEDRNGGLEWLDSVPNSENLDMGYDNFMSRIEALVMGRKTFEKVCSFDCEWPYSKPVFVLSHSLKAPPEGYEDKVEIVSGSLSEVLKHIHQKGHTELYIDGGVTVQSFLKEDLIDDMIITTVPILLGGGVPLFGELPNEIEFEHVKTEVFLNAYVQSHYKRKR